MRLKDAIAPEADTDDQWISLSDMMTGLMIIFLFIAVIHLKPIVEIEDTYKLIDDELYDALFKEFEDDLDGWGAELEKETLTVRFREPTMLYDTGSAELKEEFRIILDNFYPRYIATLRKFDLDYKNHIKEIRIDGHTSSKWKDATVEEAFKNNMYLSQNRSLNVFFYLYDMSPPYSNWAKDITTANGMSSSQTICKKNLKGDCILDNKLNIVEDSLLSQRTEFVVRTRKILAYENQS